MKDYTILCECGHELEDHHNSVICTDPPPDGCTWEKEYPHLHGSECEYWGFNEMGGLMPVDENDNLITWVTHDSCEMYSKPHTCLKSEPVKWVQHCRIFKRAEEHG